MGIKPTKNEEIMSYEQLIVPVNTPWAIGPWGHTSRGRSPWDPKSRCFWGMKRDLNAASMLYMYTFFPGFHIYIYITLYIYTLYICITLIYIYILYIYIYIHMTIYDILVDAQTHHK